MRFITQGVKVLRIVSAAFKRSFELAKTNMIKISRYNRQRRVGDPSYKDHIYAMYWVHLKT